MRKQRNSRAVEALRRAARWLRPERGTEECEFCGENIDRAGRWGEAKLVADGRRIAFHERCYTPLVAYREVHFHAPLHVSGTTRGGE